MTASLPAGRGAMPPGRPVLAPGRPGRHLRPAAPVLDPATPVLEPATQTLPLRLVAQSEGLLQIHTAPQRGSVSAVLSEALRAAGLGSRVLVCQLLKGGVNQGLEAGLSLCGRLRWLRPAVEACLAGPASGHEPAAREAVRQVWAFSREQLLSGAVDLMVLDELGLAVELGFLEIDDVVAVLERRPAPMDVILTGPPMAPQLMALADQVTQLRRSF